MKKLLSIFVFFLILLFSHFQSSTVFAHHKGVVLGDSTSSASELQFPPIASGPGLILPDSPFYFLDKVFQQIKLATAFSSELKAKVRSQIAGERLAELRVMASRNNSAGINTALTELEKEVDLSAQNLTDAAGQGKDVANTAKELNETIKAQRDVLNSLQTQSTGTLKLELEAASQALKEAKVEVEDKLPEDELRKAIEDSLNEEIQHEVEDSQESSETLERAINELEQEASHGAEKSLIRQEEALRKAIKAKDEALRKRAQQQMEEEKHKISKLSEFEASKSAAARRAVFKSKEAARLYQEALKKQLELRQRYQESNQPKPTPVPERPSNSDGSSQTSGSSGSSDESSNSGSSTTGSSGSTNSGSSNSGSSGEGSDDH